MNTQHGTYCKFPCSLPPPTEKKCARQHGMFQEKKIISTWIDPSWSEFMENDLQNPVSEPLALELAQLYLALMEPQLLPIGMSFVQRPFKHKRHVPCFKRCASPKTATPPPSPFTPTEWIPTELDDHSNTMFFKESASPKAVIANRLADCVFPHEREQSHSLSLLSSCPEPTFPQPNIWGKHGYADKNFTDNQSKLSWSCLCRSTQNPKPSNLK